MKKVLSVGEILVDFSPALTQEGGAPVYQGNPGGSTANIACVTAKLGDSTAFIGKVGDDSFGRLCIDAMARSGVDTSGIVVSREHPTTLAFVALDEVGNRSFSFYRRGTADISLTIEDIERAGVPDSAICHFGGISLTAPPSRDAVVFAIKRAKARGSIISYDPNLRLDLWESPATAKEVTLELMALADIIKISEEESRFLFGETDPALLCGEIYRRYCPAMILVTLAQNGCVAYVGGTLYSSYTYDVPTVDTTGAGDSFLGGILHCLLQFNKKPEELSPEEIHKMLDFANATGSLVTTKKGAIPAIPTAKEVEKCMAKVPKLIPKEGV